MGLKLNKISDEIVKENLEHNLAKLSELTSRGPRSSQPSDLEAYFDAVGSRSRDIGLAMYQQERDQRDIRAHLAKAADFLIREHAVRPPPAPNTSRSPWYFKQAIELGICWGDVEKRKALTSIQPWQYRNPPHTEHDGLVEYLQLLLRFVTEQRVEPASCQPVELRFTSDTASKEEREELLPGARGLRGVAERAEDLWNEAIADLVKAHEVEAKKGEYKRSEEGFMCLPGLALAKLGMERGLTCRVRSIYLPLALLQST
ncbi:Imm49 family immunity protein [Sorangium sp. So ce429]